MPRPSTSGVIPAAGSDDRPPGPAEDLELAGIRADPLAFLQDLVSEYGDLCSHRTRGQNVWFANSPELVQHILKDNYTNYTKAGTPDDFMLTPCSERGCSPATARSGNASGGCPRRPSAAWRSSRSTA